MSNQFFSRDCCFNQARRNGWPGRPLAGANLVPEARGIFEEQVTRATVSHELHRALLPGRESQGGGGSPGDIGVAPAVTQPACPYPKII